VRNFSLLAPIFLQDVLNTPELWPDRHIYIRTFTIKGAHWPGEHLKWIQKTATMSSGTLYIRDSRTNAEYEIPIRRNAVSAVNFKRIKAPAAATDRADQVTGGLRVHDPGLQNTTVVETGISFSCGPLNFYVR
jgi:hypothetical protein